MNGYDVIVIGGGPGGYVAALRAGALGMKTLLVEDRALGGTCLNWGCIPAKALIESAETFARVSGAAEFGVGVSGATIDYPAMVQRKSSVVARLVRGVAGLLKARKVEVVMGRAAFTDPKTLSITPNDKSAPIAVRGDKIIIATGSKPVRPGFLPWGDKRVMTSDELFDMTTLPESMLVMGGGVIGCEFVSMYAQLGVKVTVVEMLDRLLAVLDDELSKEITKSFKKAKVKLHLGTKLEKLDASGAKLVAALASGESVEADVALISVGRRANTEGLGLEKAGVVVRKDGSVEVNEFCQTAQAHIYAIGDVNGQFQLAHVASHHGLVAVGHIAGGTHRVDIKTVPNCVYTHPQIATVGLTEAEARAKGLEVHTAKFNFAGSGRALTAGVGEGFVKLVGVKTTGRILGAQIVGPEATELIATVAVAMRNQLTVHELAHTIFAHPTLSEALMESAESFIGEGVHSL